MTEHINHIKTLSEHVETIDDRIAEKNLLILSISLPEEYVYLITALQIIAKDHLSWDYIRDRLIHESEKKNIVKLRHWTKLFSYQNIPRSSLNVITANCYKKKNDLKKKKIHAKLASDDKTSIGKPDDLALKSSNQIKNADW